MGNTEKPVMLGPAEEDPDLPLVRQFLAGDESAFDELVSRYRSHVYNICLQMLGNRSDAEDAAQEVFVAVYEGFVKFGFRSAVSTWVYRICVNRCVSYRRKRKPQAAAEIEPAGPSARFEEVEKRRTVGRALQRVPGHYRVVLVLKYYRGFSYEEIAEVLGWSEDKVKCYLHRARNRFKEVFKQELEDER